MDKKKVFKDSLDACKSAEFHKAFNLIKNSYGEVDNKCAINLMVGCCNACVQNTSSPENVCEDELFMLLEHVTSYLSLVKEGDQLSYLQSIFFIVKLLAKKECYRVIARMEEMLIPRFLSLSLSNKHRETYQSCASILYNLVARAVTEEYIRYNKALLKISYMVATINSKVSNITTLLDMSYNCAINLSKLDISAAEQVRFFFHVLNLLKVCDKQLNSEEHFKSFISCFTLILNNLLKQFEFEMAAEFYKKVFAVGIYILGELAYVNILTLLRFPLILLPLNRKHCSLDDLEECKKSLKKLRDLCSKQLVGNKLNILLHTVVLSYYKTLDRERWCKFSEDVQLEILQFIYSVSQFEVQSKYTCPCKCPTGKNIYQQFAYLQYISTLVELSVTQSKLALDTHQKVVKLLVNFSEGIKILRENGCDKWKMAWNSLGMAMYNTGVRLYQKGDGGYQGYFYTLIRYFVKFEARTGFVILRFSLVSSAFSALCCISLQANDYEKCMAFTALAVYLCPRQRDSLMMNWIKAKATQRDLKTLESEEVQRITLVSAFKRFETEISNLTGDFNLLTMQDKVDLLTFELEQYKRLWKSKIPMLSSLKELCNTADITTTVKVVVKIFGECELNLHVDVPKILRNVLKQYEAKVSTNENETPESNIFLAILYFLQYKYCVNDTITKNADDMEKSMLLGAQSGASKDPNGECDIVSSYESLRLDKYSAVLQNLNRSVTLFASVLADFDPSCLETLTISFLYDLLLKISFDYRLHHHRVRSFQALQMALKLAQLDNNPCHIVQIIGFIIEYGDITKSYVKYLILIADKEVNGIECSNLANLKLVLTYYVCRAKAFLYHDYKEAYRIFQVASELYKVQEDKAELDLIKCQLLVLHYKFVMMPCAFDIVDHMKSTLLTIHSACGLVFDIYNKSKIGGSYEMSVLLGTNSEIIKLYHNLRAPREVRAYCKETIILAQKLVLPLQCASYLVYLAHADLRSTRYADCQVKLDGLADILYLTRHKPQVEQENKAPVVKDFTNEMEGITNDMQEMVLDLPMSSSYTRQFSPGSPALVIQSFHLPDFVSHGGTCDCFYCVCFEYQELALEKIRLDALINVKQNSPIVARDFFHGGLDFHECCVRKYDSFVETVSNFISHDLVPEFEREFSGAYGNLLLNYSYHLMRYKNKTEALGVTNKLINLVLPRKIELVYLYNEALVQKLGYIAEVPCIAINSSVEADADNMLPQTSDLSTTPESKHSKVMVPIHYSPSMSPPKRVPKKCLKFTLSPIDDDNASQRPKIATPAIKKAPKTPAPKIQIYSNEDFTAQAKTPAPKLQIFIDTRKSTKKKPRTNANDLFLAPPNLETASTPFCDKPDSALKGRTKLLTEKLRQSTKKPEGTSVGACNANSDQSEVQNGKKNMSVRKNLLSELTTSENEQSAAPSGAIRKSSRQRKV